MMAEKVVTEIINTQPYMCGCNSEQVYKMAEKVLTDLINTQPHICSYNSEQVKIEHATKSKTIISSKIQFKLEINLALSFGKLIP